MIMIPLPLFASLLLAGALVWFVAHRDMRLRAHQLFAALVFGYCAISVLISVRWGYGVQTAATLIALLAPILPALAWLAYRALSGARKTRHLWPLAVIAANWSILATSRDLADLAILSTYIGFGLLLLHHARQGESGLALSPMADTGQILLAMRVTGGALVASGLMDVFILYDFIFHDGRHIGTAVSVAQFVFVFVVGLISTLGHSTDARAEAEPDPEADTTEEDSAIIARLDQLLDHHIHRDEDLSLRKLSRRLGLPDRKVSNAINRVKGTNVSQYVNAFRIREACDLLSETDQSVLQISLAGGFASKSNFNREFQRVTGKTPSAWRTT